MEGKNTKVIKSLSLTKHSLTFIFLQNIAEQSIWPMLLQESLKALGGLGLLSLGGKFLLRRVFEVCAINNRV